MRPGIQRRIRIVALLFEHLPQCRVYDFVQWINHYNDNTVAVGRGILRSHLVGIPQAGNNAGSTTFTLVFKEPQMQNRLMAVRGRCLRSRCKVHGRLVHPGGRLPPPGAGPPAGGGGRSGYACVPGPLHLTGHQTRGPAGRARALSCDPWGVSRLSHAQGARWPSTAGAVVSGHPEGEPPAPAKPGAITACLTATCFSGPWGDVLCSHLLTVPQGLAPGQKRISSRCYAQEYEATGHPCVP